MPRLRRRRGRTQGAESRRRIGADGVGSGQRVSFSPVGVASGEVAVPLRRKLFEFAVWN